MSCFMLKPAKTLCMYILYIILFLSVNQYPFTNTTALKYIHTFVAWTSMTAFDHNFNSQG